MSLQALNSVQRKLDTRVLTPKKVVEKAKKTIRAEEEFFDVANELYSFKMKPEDQEKLRLILIPEAQARSPNLGFDNIDVGVVESDPTSMILIEQKLSE